MTRRILGVGIHMLSGREEARVTSLLTAMAKYVELRRHTDADGDVLTADGVQAALAQGRKQHASGAPRGRS